MQFSELLNLADLSATPVGDAEIASVTADSRQVRPGACFVAVRGTTVDGHRYVKDALAAGGRRRRRPGRIGPAGRRDRRRRLATPTGPSVGLPRPFAGGRRGSS